MMMRVSEELIWHFIGYLHLSEAISTARVSFKGYHHIKGEDEIEDFAIGSGSSYKSNDYLAHIKAKATAGVLEQKSANSSGGYDSDGPSSGNGLPELPTNPYNYVSDFFLQAENGFGGASEAPEGLPKTYVLVQYRYYDTQWESTTIDQKSIVCDDDRITGLDAGPSLAEIYHLLSLMVQYEGDGTKQQVELEELKDNPGIYGVRYVDGVKQPVIIDATSDGEGEAADSETPVETDLVAKYKKAAQDIGTGGNEQINFATVQSGLSDGPVNGDVDIDQENDLSDEDEIINPVVKNLGTLNQEFSAPSDDTSATESTSETDGEADAETEPELESSAKLLTQEIDTGDNAQYNVAQVETALDGTYNHVDVGINQDNDMEDDDTIDNPQVINTGTLTQVVTATDGTASSGSDVSGEVPVEGEGGEEQGTQETLQADPPTLYGSEQSANLGGNQASNVASITDFTEAKGSMIVYGDYDLHTCIHQSIVLVDDDEVQGGGAFGIDPDINSGVNEAENDAQWIHDTLAQYGNSTTGSMSPGFHWQVDYIKGDYHDVTEIWQEAYIFDNDVSIQTGVNQYSSVEVGGNTIFNEAHIFEPWADYDLIVVKGDYLSEISIYQKSILLDNDILKLAEEYAAGAEYEEGDSGMQLADTSGNDLFNKASILTVGGDGFHDLNAEQNADVSRLAASIHNPTYWSPDEEDTGYIAWDFDLETPLPGDGSDLFKVLFVNGDYYESKSIHQEIVVGDADYGEQELYDAFDELEDGLEDLDEAEFDSLLQQMNSGGNELGNNAVIADIGSTSDFMYLGGTYYRSDMLYQSELVTTDVEDIPEAGSPEEALAALGGNESVSVETKEQLLAMLGNQPEDDMVGAVLA